MLLLAHFDLTNADLTLFDDYERAVLPLLAGHGGELRHRWRSLDNALEVHLLHFTRPEGLQTYLNDPERADYLDLWRRSGASATLIEVQDKPA